jgi:hypothetical protein
MEVKFDYNLIRVVQCGNFFLGRKKKRKEEIKKERKKD